MLGIPSLCSIICFNSSIVSAPDTSRARTPPLRLLMRSCMALAWSGGAWGLGVRRAFSCVGRAEGGRREEGPRQRQRQRRDCGGGRCEAGFSRFCGRGCGEMCARAALFSGTSQRREGERKGRARKERRGPRERVRVCFLGEGLVFGGGLLLFACSVGALGCAAAVAWTTHERQRRRRCWGGGCAARRTKVLCAVLCLACFCLSLLRVTFCSPARSFQAENNQRMGE